MLPRKILMISRQVSKPIMLQLKRWMFKLLPYRPDSFSREDFELQYSSGRYDYLRGLSELVHYSVLIGYCHYLKPAGSILDVGCGEGILQERLEPGKYSRYIGIDISHEAIRRTSHRQDARTLFITADVLTYIPSERFDIIVFNECLYHFRHYQGLECTISQRQRSEGGGAYAKL
jgi:2-polyprenyl-3-methyl-5-hydroxy-6-metoxy-1,4-benzoquinol methylase